MANYPAVHPAVVEQFVDRDLPGITRLFPVNLDVKQAEFVRCLLVNQTRCRFTADATDAIPVFESTHPQFESLYCENKPPVSIVVDFHDKGRRFDFLGLTAPIWATIRQHNLQVIYLKLQIHEPTKYQELNELPNNVHILSCPLLLGGSRLHITIQDDFEGDALFSTVLKSNPTPTYQYDWSFVGSPTSDDRAAAFEILTPYESRERFFTISKPGHASASVATVPMDEMLRISRASKVCLSLNGRGPWCLKDGELLAANCMVLRQHHPVLTLNPLTPRDGVHWAVAKTEDLVGTIESLLADDGRRKRIRRAGFEMFSDVLLRNRWSNVYAERLEVFLATNHKQAWGDLAVA